MHNTKHGKHYKPKCHYRPKQFANGSGTKLLEEKEQRNNAKPDADDNGIIDLKRATMPEYWNFTQALNGRNHRNGWFFHAIGKKCGSARHSRENRPTAVPSNQCEE